MSASTDDAFRALTDPERRRILRALVDSPDLPAEGVDPLDHAPVGDGSPPEPFHIRLHHIHLPMLEQAGFVEWDPGARRIRRGPNFATVQSLLEALGDDLVGATRVR